MYKGTHVDAMSRSFTKQKVCLLETEKSCFIILSTQMETASTDLRLSNGSQGMIVLRGLYIHRKP